MAKKFNKWEYVGENRVSVLGGEPKPKKLTATRMGAVLGLNQWKTPFQAWCEIMRVAEPPFEGNKFTEFGKIVEPMLHEFCLDYISPKLQRPRDVYGDKTDYIYDYYPDDPIYGGMWDDRVPNRKGSIVGIVEYKSSSRPQDWVEEPPPYYRAQALQYAYKEGVDDYWLVCTFPSPEDYDNPEDYVVSDENTRIWAFKTSEEFAGMDTETVFATGADWWEVHVVGNLSPAFDEKLDKEYLDIMRTNVVELPNDVAGLSKKIASLDDKIAALYAKSGIKQLESERKDLVDKVFKAELEKLLEDNMTIIETEEYAYKQSKPSTEIDKAAMKKDGVLEKYTKEKPGSWRLTRKKAD